MPFCRRPLHYVFKVADRKATMHFCINILGMHVLRHEEFDEGCKASCNGRYDGKWSKTMIGYGSEDDHFVLELVYNYGIKDYERGTEFYGVVVQEPNIIRRANEEGYPVKEDDHGETYLEAPGGYRFFLRSGPSDGDPVKEVIYKCTSLENTQRFWSMILDCKAEIAKKDNVVVVPTSLPSFTLKFRKLGDSLKMGDDRGRIALSCPREHIAEAEAIVKETKLGSIRVPLVSLDTPGKATVEVVILGDPDGHEICFVGDEAYRELSKADPESEKVMWEKIEEYEKWKASGKQS